MLGTIINKPLITDEQCEQYAQCAEWCNNNHAMIMDMEEHYIVVEIPAPALDEVKANKIAQLKAERDKAEQKPVTTDKGTFDVDDKALMRIDFACKVLQSKGGEIEWTLADNTRIVVNLDDLNNVCLALGVQSAYVHEKYTTLKEQVNTCETIEQVNAIAWDNEDVETMD